MKGHEGWDDYAPYYDWENRQTVGRRDIAFWPPSLEELRRDKPVVGADSRIRLRHRAGRDPGCARRARRSIGIDRSESMLARARTRVRRAKLQSRVKLIRGDIRHLPFPDRSFPLVMAPYGILQSLLDERLLSATLKDVRRVLTRNGTFGVELVADLPAWDEYSNRVTFRSKRGPHGKPIQLVESVKQDRRKHITRFEQEFVEGRGKSGDAKEIQPGIPDPERAANGAATGKSRAGGLGPSRRLSGRAVGPARRGVDYSRPSRPRALGWKCQCFNEFSPPPSSPAYLPLSRRNRRPRH